MDLSWLIPIMTPLLPPLVERASGLVTERLPSSARDLVPLALGAGIGIVGHAAGLTPEQSAALAGWSGLGAVGYHRLRRPKLKVKSSPGADSRLVTAESLPPKP